MKHYTRVPAINGKQLIRLLENDGWKMRTERATHGVALTKTFRDRTRVTIVPDTSASLDDGTLAAILGTKQTCIGKAGLLELINKYGM